MRYLGKFVWRGKNTPPPIRNRVKVEKEYLLEDNGVQKEIERHHIDKPTNDQLRVDNEIQDLKKEIGENNSTSIMDKELSMYEVGTTLVLALRHLKSNGISSKLIDMVSRQEISHIRVEFQFRVQFRV